MKFERLVYFAILFAVVLFPSLIMFNSCKHDGIPATEFRTVHFSEVKPIFIMYCGKCHNGTDSEGGVNLNDSIGILKAVVPYNADKSKAYKAMVSTIQIMPPDIAMTSNERTLIRLWIEQGASPN